MADRLNFQRLNDGKTWGVKIQSMRPDSRHMAGQDVDVPKASGGYSRVRLGSVEQKWSYAQTLVTVYRIAGRSAAGISALRRHTETTRQQRQDEKMKSIVMEEGRKAKIIELDTAERALADYDPADQEYFDGETEIQEAHEARLVQRVESARATYTALREAYRRSFLVTA